MKTNNSVIRAWSYVAFAWLFASLPAGCNDGNGQSSSKTNWIVCNDDSDCAAYPGARCGPDGFCVDNQGEPFNQPSATGGAGSSSASSIGGNPGSDGGPSAGGTATGGGPALTGGAGGAAGNPAAECAALKSTECFNNCDACCRESGASSGTCFVGSQAEVCVCSTIPSCEGSPNFPTPPFDKSCASAADCFVGIHLADCCGSRIALGYNDSARSAFDSFEADCTMRAVCDCPQDSDRLEGGQATSDIASAYPECVTGQCVALGIVNTGE
jgi:hypothetical protein